MTPITSEPASIVYVGTYPPRECGIATFTQDLIRAIDQTFAPRITSKVIAMNVNATETHPYSKKVIFQIDQRKDEDYKDAAALVNAAKDIKAVNVQHEYGIYGGEQGEKLLLFLQNLEKPVFTTLHTVLPQPEVKMREVTQGIIDASTGIIVQTKLAKSMLLESYSVDEKKISVIPHGIHPVLFTDPKTEKKRMRLKGKAVISTFGLLSRGKGIEYVLRSLPPVIEKHPEVVYYLIGQTHPSIRRQEGEKYRDELLQLVEELGISKNVRFFDKYLQLSEILQYLQATDIYVATSLDPNQTVSGTLSYATGSGRAVVTTAFAQAKELVDETTGRLVEFRSPEEYSKALLELLDQPELRSRMQFNAYTKTRHMLWSNVALSYLRLFNQFVPNLMINEKNLSDINLNHIRRMTDSFGMLQFAKLSQPDSESGYTVDDNARALLVTAQHFQKTGFRPALTLVNTYLRYLKFAQQPDGKWINYYTYEQVPSPQEEDEKPIDPHARAIWALGQISTYSQLPEATRRLAREQLEIFFAGNHKLTPLRPRAFLIKGLVPLAKAEPSEDRWKRLIRENAEVIAQAFESFATPDWQWYEDTLCYANGVLPEAMILASEILNEPRYKKIGLTSLEFLISHTFQGPIYVPIGSNGWFTKNKERALFDQQPEDVVATVQALRAAHRNTREKRYHDLMFQAFSWFLGNNLSGTLIYDKKSGGCYDGLHPHGPNLNQGAESTVSYLLARLTVTEGKKR